MKKVILFAIVILFLFVQPALALDTEKCKDCHGEIIPIQLTKLTKNCDTCHITHGCFENCLPVPLPQSGEIHEIHRDAGKKQPKQYGGCTQCHKSPVICTDCHNSHENVKINESQDKNASVCTNCHGKLPEPRGHETFRVSLSKYKHQWMTCDTCHLNPFIKSGEYEFKLRFKDLVVISIDNSTELCKICHSSQYEKLNLSKHGDAGDKCVDCHNPHTTQFGPEIQITPKETPVNVSVKVESTRKWVVTKVPILNNPFTVSIILIVVAVVIAEYLLSRHEEGTKVVYHMVKVQEKEDNLGTLEVKLRNQNIERLNNLLKEHGVSILGMTMSKEKTGERTGERTGEMTGEGGDGDIYKYVLFIGSESYIGETKEKEIIDTISSISDVKSVEFTDKYEL